jgi:uncharacterized protein YbjQ (UPF0145 family)
MFELLLNLSVLGLLVLAGWIFGGANERRHLRELEQRERRVARMLLTGIRTFPGGADPEWPPTLVTADAVIAGDFLKHLLAGLRKIVGGELRSYETLMTRARREAVLRVLESAQRQGYDAVCNLRLETVEIGGARGATIEVGASATAYRRPAPAPE